MELTDKGWDELLDKLVKLKSLADRPGTVEEGAAVAAKLQDLLFKHNLAMSTLEGHKTKGEGKDLKQYMKTHLSFGSKTEWLTRWKRDLLYYVCQYNFGRMLYFDGTSSAYIVAKEHNTIVIKHLYEYLLGEIERLCRDEWKRTEYYGDKSSGSMPWERKWKASFRLGAVLVVARKMRVQRETSVENTNSHALVVQTDQEIEAATNAMFPNIKQDDPKEDKIVREAFQLGREAGSGISLDKQLSGATSKTS